MAVHSKRLASGFSGAANAEPVIYTTPAGRTTIVKDLRVVNAVSSSVTVVLIAQRPDPPGVYLLSQVLATAGAVAGVPLWTVLGPGDMLRIRCTQASGVAFWVSGTELEGVAT